MGPSPSDRLRAAAGVQRVPSPKLELFIARAFLDAETCAALVRLIDAKRRPSEIADDVGVANFRTSETCDLDPADPVVTQVDAAICDLLGIASQQGEQIQGQRYAIGQEFRAHTDTFEPGGADFFTHCADSPYMLNKALMCNLPDIIHRKDCPDK